MTPDSRKSRDYYYRTQGEGNIFRSVCLYTLVGVPTSAYWGVCLLSSLCLGGWCLDCDPGATATVATHPTGMPSRLQFSWEQRNLNIALINTFYVKILF